MAGGNVTRIQVVTRPAVLLGAARNAPIEVTFSKIYGDHMVLQRAPEKAQLWGHCVGCADGVPVRVNVVRDVDGTAVASGSAVGEWHASQVHSHSTDF